MPDIDEFSLARSCVIASEAKQSRGDTKDWIASSQALLAMTVRKSLPIVLRRSSTPHAVSFARLDHDLKRKIRRRRN
ncbi:MAG TPA: hypothetical protein VF467_10885, partial [Afipia sp.]